MRVLMWEAGGDAAALIDWWRAQVGPALPDGCDAELFRGEDRLVAVLRPAPADLTPGWQLPDPPLEITERPTHSWSFTTVERRRDPDPAPPYGGS